MSNFNDVAHPELRAYNRVMFCKNLLSIGGEGRVEKYLKQFSDEDLSTYISVAMEMAEGGDLAALKARMASYSTGEY